MVRVALLVVGGLAMIAQEKKDPPKKDDPDAKYDERITIRAKSSDGKIFLKDVDGIKVYRKEKDGKMVFHIKGGSPKDGGYPARLFPESELTDKDKVVWVVEKWTNDDAFGIRATCTKKPEPK